MCPELHHNFFPWLDTCLGGIKTQVYSYNIEKEQEFQGKTMKQVAENYQYISKKSYVLELLPGYILWYKNLHKLNLCTYYL